MLWFAPSALLPLVPPELFQSSAVPGRILGVSTALRSLLSSSLQPLENASGRYIIKSSGSKTELRILKLDIEQDGGDYSCNGTNSYGSGEATVNLRVRSRLAALWPFLGIVAEVLVLVTIIFIYEKRRKPDEVPDGKRHLGLNLSGKIKGFAGGRVVLWGVLMSFSQRSGLRVLRALETSLYHATSAMKLPVIALFVTVLQ